MNDTTIEVTFGKEIDKDFIREAELSGKYFAVYTEGNSVQSNDTVQSEKINFSNDGKKAEFTLKDAIESGKKYHVALLDGDNNKVADVIHTYGPAVLKSAADAPSFDVSAVADKIFVKYNTKMKDAAKDIKNYTVYDEGGQKLGPLALFLVDSTGEAVSKDTDEYTGDAKGDWVNLNDKKEVEFQLGANSEKKLQAGKTYKLVVDEKVKTDDNKTLSESNRTIKVKTPSVKDASPVAKVARITDDKTLTLIFDQDISNPAGADKSVTLNKAQLNLKTSTGKTVDMDKYKDAKVENDNTLVLTFDDNTFDPGLTYKVDMPANIVQNGIFTNAMNESSSGLTAKAQENISIASMKAQLLADPKNDAKADLVLTFDQVPNLEALKDANGADNIVIYDGRDKYVLQNLNTAKIYGGDIDGKSIIIEDVKNFEHTSKGALEVRGDKTYDVEIAKNALETASFDKEVPATNKEKLKASTKGISVAAPIVDEVRLQSAEKIEIEFKEEIKGNVSASDLNLDAYVANRSDIFDGTSTLKEVSGSGYYDVKISGKVMTITAKTGVKFPTSLDDTNIEIDPKVFTNKSGKVGNEKIVIDSKGFAMGESPSTSDYNKDDVVDNAAPVIVSVYAETANTAEVTFSENVKFQGNNTDIASLFFTDKGEDSSTGVEITDVTNNTAVITFKENYWKDSTDLSVVTLKYSKGNSYYIQDKASNKMDTQTIKGFFKDNSSDAGSSTEVEDPDKPEIDKLLGKVQNIEFDADAVADATKSLLKDGETADNLTFESEDTNWVTVDNTGLAKLVKQNATGKVEKVTVTVKATVQDGNTSTTKSKDVTVTIQPTAESVTNKEAAIAKIESANAGYLFPEYKEADTTKAKEYAQLITEAKTDFLGKAEKQDVQLGLTHTNPVWVEVHKDGTPVGEGGMTDAPAFGTAKIQLETTGEYLIVVKDKENGTIVEVKPLTVR